MERIYLFIIFLVLCIISITNYFIIRDEIVPFIHDSLGFYIMGVNFYNNLKSQSLLDWPFFIWNFYLHGTGHKCPFVILITIPFYFIFGINHIVPKMINIFFLGILLYSTYFIGKRLYNSKVGLVASLVLASFPIIIGHSRLYWLDFPLCSMVTLSIALLLYSNNFQNTFFSVLFGISAYMGFLTKQFYPIFVLPLLVYMIYSSLRKSVKPLKIINIFLSLSIFISLSFTWYWPNFKINVDYFLRAAEAPGSKLPFYLKLSRYVNILRNIELHKFYFSLFFIALILFLKNKEYKDPILLIWTVTPLVIYSFMKIGPLPRYILSILPGMALIISVGINKLKKKIATLLCIIILIIGFLHLILLHIDYRYQDKRYHKARFNKEGLISPLKWDIEIEEIFELIKNNSNKIAVIPDMPLFVGALTYKSVLMKNSPVIETPTMRPTRFKGSYIRFEDYVKLISNKSFILRYDYVIYFDVFLGSSKEEILVNKFKESLISNKDKFSLIRNFNFSYEENAIIYKKI